VSLAGEALFGPLREGLGRDFRLGEPPIVLPAALGDRSACIGAATLAIDLVERITE
jgi:hypothetical protein